MKRIIIPLFQVTLLLTGIFIMLSHPEEDDPAGFLALCLAATLVTVFVAITTAKFEKKVKLSLNGN